MGGSLNMDLLIFLHTVKLYRAVLVALVTDSESSTENAAQLSNCGLNWYIGIRKETAGDSEM
jgi:hypothetical protein